MMWTEIPEIGRLEQVKIHGWYDGPLMMSCTDSGGKLYLAAWWTIDLDENWEEWIYIPMSQERYTALEANEMDLRSAYLQAEGGKVFIVRFMAQDQMTGTWVESKGLSPETLPVAGVFIEDPE